VKRAKLVTASAAAATAGHRVSWRVNRVSRHLVPQGGAVKIILGKLRAPMYVYEFMSRTPPGFVQSDLIISKRAAAAAGRWGGDALNEEGHRHDAVFQIPGNALRNNVGAVLRYTNNSNNTKTTTSSRGVPTFE